MTEGMGQRGRRWEGVRGDKEAGTEGTPRGPSGLLEETRSHGEWPTGRDTLHLGQTVKPNSWKGQGLVTEFHILSEGGRQLRLQAGQRLWAKPMSGEGCIRKEKEVRGGLGKPVEQQDRTSAGGDHPGAAPQWDRTVTTQSEENRTQSFNCLLYNIKLQKTSCPCPLNLSNCSEYSLNEPTLNTALWVLM